MNYKSVDDDDDEDGDDDDAADDNFLWLLMFRFVGPMKVLMVSLWDPSDDDDDNDEEI